VDPDAHGVLQGPEGEGVGLDALDVEELRVPPGGDDQVVVIVAGGIGQQFPAGEIDVFDGIGDDLHPGSAEDPVETDLHRVGLHPGAGHLVQFRHQSVVVVPVDESELHIGVLFQLFVDFLEGFHAAVSAAKHYYAGFFRHTASLPRADSKILIFILSHPISSVKGDPIFPRRGKNPGGALLIHAS